MPILNLNSDPQPLVIAYRSLTFRLDAAANQVATNDKLVSFAELPAGWHYGEGTPPSKALVSRLIEINNEVYLRGFSKTDAFPGVSGNIMLTIYSGEHLIDLTVEPDGKTATYSYEKNGEEIAYQEDIELSTAIKMIEQVGELCRLSEPSISFTTQRLNTGSKALPLKPLPMGEYLFLTPSAQFDTPKPFAATLAGITYQSGSLAIQPFTGNLTPIFYLPAALGNQK